MYNIIQLNDKDLSELQVIAKELGIKKGDSYKKEDLVYKILDEQAIVGATKKVAADKLKEERKEGQKNKRSRVAPAKKEDKVVSPTKSGEVNKSKETAPAKPQQPSLKKEGGNKEKEVADAKAENAAPKRKVGRPRKNVENTENKEAENAKPIEQPKVEQPKVVEQKPAVENTTETVEKVIPVQSDEKKEKVNKPILEKKVIDLSLIHI